MIQSRGDSHFSNDYPDGSLSTGPMPPPPARPNGNGNGRTTHDYMGVSVLLNLNAGNTAGAMDDSRGVGGNGNGRRSAHKGQFGNSGAFASEGMSIASGPSGFSPSHSGSRSDSSPDSNEDNQNERGESPPRDATADCILPVYGIGV
eukprot:TRINITY_DN3662_c0_g1_i1.p1 TRINITY_DN3662_c0_g1~~TRINITY_DN3662_c0_g1_i1.p1  ORF type:complete len:147 (+),score=12.32 TRINITY_DN3662_c0_g1_i1:187-627(+)